MLLRAVAATVILTWVIPAGAQQAVRLQFQGGRVSLVAQNASLRTILSEWARLGGATVVNGDQLTGPPVTLELTGVPERQAIAIILREAAGYLLAPRRAGSTGLSEFDRIVILPTSVAPRQPAAATGAVQRPVLLRPPVGARPVMPEPPDDADSSVEVEPQLVTPAGSPRPILAPLARPGAANVQVLTSDGDSNDAPGPSPVVPTTPANPFGLPFGSSAIPGTIAPPPPAEPQRPGSNPVQ